ncbi:MAG: urease accessory protein UreD [Chitinispirillales bacterium]|jgi:urease accessory protein|nr:urease accessory protein UreD [Chitinispirillales bacterium]
MSELYAKTGFQNGRTVLTGCAFTSPLKIAKPFYRDSGYTELMVMCASPGMLSGDRFDMAFDMGENTKTIISTQSCQKLYNTGEGAAAQSLKIEVGENASLFYCPYPAIPFAKNRFRASAEIALSRSSKLFFGDILSCGRHGMGERFAFSEYVSKTTVSIDGKPAFVDASRLIPSEAAVGGIGFFEGYTCQGLLYLYGYETVSLPKRANLEAAVSRSHKGQSVRILSNDADAVYRFAVELFWAGQASDT